MGTDELTTLKILIIGECGVGKSSILMRFTDGCFDPNILSTIGIDYKSKVTHVGGKLLKLGLWELAGGGRFRLLNPHYYKGVQGAIFVYDVSDRKTFDKIPELIEECERHSSKKNTVKLLIGNKVDKLSREVTRLEGVKLARKHAMIFIETSQKTNDDIGCAVNEVVERILQTPGLVEAPTTEEIIHYSHFQRTRDDCLCSCQKTSGNRIYKNLGTDILTTLKILIIGECRVGKSSILMRFTDGCFDPDTPKTIGIDYKSKVIKVGGKLLKLGLWELAGGGRYRVLNPYYYQGAHGAIFVYDVTSRGTFDKIPELLKECKKYASKENNIVKLLIGNKVDKLKREVVRLEGVQLARENAMFFIEASQMTKNDVGCAINEVAERILQSPGLLEPHSMPKRMFVTPRPMYSAILFIILFSVVIFL